MFKPKTMYAKEELECALAYAAEEAAKLTLCSRTALQNLRKLDSNSEKLVYLFLCIAQLQTFTGIRRTLGMAKATLSRTLKRLKEKGLVAVKGFLYWTNSSEAGR